jgi:hypothetical protein
VIRKTCAVAVAIVLGSTAATAQQSRPELLRAAVLAADDFAAERALDLVKAAVNPALGPLDSTWVRSVHLLTQLLVEANSPDQARTWARWATRTLPGMRIDSVNFTAAVANALREAQAFSSARSAGDAVTQVSWRWVARGSRETNGRILLGQSRMPVAVSVRVVGGSFITAAGTSVAPGSYEIEAGAPGYLPARLTREVLPGVTTVLTFELTSAAVAADVVAENVRSRAFQNVAPMTVRRFTAAPSCAAATYVSRDGLLITSYLAIRGADSITLAGVTQPVRIAAHDVAGDLAVLHIGGTRTDSVAVAANIADGQSAWAVRLADCRTATEARVRVTQWNSRPTGRLQLSDIPAAATVGSMLFDVAGRLTAVWSSGNTAIAAPQIAALIATARRNVAAGTLASAADVARRENHQYGSVAIATDLNPATVKASPLETWQWEALQTSGAAPLTLIGPMGRYRLEVTGPGGARREQDVTIRPAAHERLVVTLRNVAQATQGSPSPVVKKRSKLPWILGGVAAVGGAAAMAMGGGGGGGGGPTPPPPATTGTISVSVPVNPPLRSLSFPLRSW